MGLKSIRCARYNNSFKLKPYFYISKTFNVILPIKKSCTLYNVYSQIETKCKPLMGSELGKQEGCFL